MHPWGGRRHVVVVVVATVRAHLDRVAAALVDQLVSLAICFKRRGGVEASFSLCSID